MAPIQVFVFVDIGCVKGNSKNLTEVSLLAVPRSQFKDPDNEDEPQDKITLNFKKMDYKEADYKEAFKQIDEFIRKFEKPVCLVAHNGINFDFQIIKEQLENWNISLPDDLLCADSLYAFYDILKAKPKINDRDKKLLLDFDTNPLNNNCSKLNKQAMTEKDNTNAKDMKGYEQNNKKSNSHEIPEEQGTSGDPIEDEHVYPCTSKIKTTIQTNDIAFDKHTDAKPETSDYIANDKEVTDANCYKSNDDLEAISQMQLKNENTPGKRTLEATSEPIDNKRQKLDSKSVNPLDPGNAKRKLWEDDESGEEFAIEYKGQACRENFYELDKKPPYPENTLGTLYKRYVKYPDIKPHPAEIDVYMEFRISHKLGKRFLSWTNQIQLKFTDVPKRPIVFFN